MGVATGSWPHVKAMKRQLTLTGFFSETDTDSELSKGTTASAKKAHDDNISDDSDM